MLSFLNKFHIPDFLKTKKFVILLSILILIFLFAPISLHQIGQKIENFINSKAISGVESFEKQTGLKIRWSALDFNIFIMTVVLEDVQVHHLNEFHSKKIEELKFLDGLQKIKKISARPSLYSLLFDKKIILSKLNIERGDISLKTLKRFKTKAGNSQDIKLPIKKISIKNTDIRLQHNRHTLQFSNIKAVISQKGPAFNFKFFVNNFYFRKHSSFESFLNVKPIKQDENKVYQLSMKGSAKQNQISFSQINIQNEFFSSSTNSLEIDFNSNGLMSLDVVSSGSLPLSLIQDSLSLINKQIQFSNANLTYDFSIKYKKNKGYIGAFFVSSKDFVFKTEKLKSFSLKGDLKSYFLSINKGHIKTENQGDVYIKSAKWFFLQDTLPFSFSVKTEQLSSDSVVRTVLNIPYSPVKGILTGSVACQGRGKTVDYLKCDIKGKSQKVKLQPENQETILSFYGFDLDSSLEWKDQQLEFELKGVKDQFATVNFKGRYSQISDEFSTSYSFSGKLGEDLIFNIPLSLKGRAELSNGRILIKNNKVKLSGRASSPKLNIQSYYLENISGLYNFKNNKLSFVNIEGRPGQTNYLAEVSLDFNKKTLNVFLDSKFFSIKDFIKALNKPHFPVDLKGSGTASFFLYWPWDQVEKKEFQLTGDFFNVIINKDFFSQSTFDFSFKNQKGFVHSLLFRKGQGLIEGSGSFDENYQLNLEMTGQKLPLESIELLNHILPFNQSGDINFNAEIKGSLNDPNIKGKAVISNTFLYSYPVKDSLLNLKINKSGLSFSGNIIDEITIDQFVYPFSNQSKLKIKGWFHNFDLIKILLSKDKKDKIQDYSSQLKGSFDIEKNINNSLLEGQAKIEQLFISKADQWLKTVRPFSISFQKNKWSLTPTKFIDYNNKTFHIKRAENDKLLLKGSASLSFFSIMTPFFKEFDGEVTGQILLNNNLKQLQPKGSLQVSKGLLSIYSLPEFTNVSAQLIFSNNSILINDFKSLAGGGEVKGIGNVLYNFVNNPVVNLNLSFDSVHFQIPEGFNTKGSGKIKIKGSSPPYLISGEYHINSGSIVREFSAGKTDKKYDFALLEKRDIKKKSIFELDLNFETKQAVSVSSSLIRSSVEGQANIYGPFNSLLMKGKFNLAQNIKQGLIFFRGQEFKISSGSILFKDSSPTNPYLDISAETVFKEPIKEGAETTIDALESREEIEREYKIFLSVKGFSQNLDFFLKSIPILNEKEIISLLTLGVSSRHFDTQVKQSESVGNYSYQIITSFLIEKTLNKEIKNALDLDFRLTPYINTLNKPVTKVTLSKSWFDKWRTSFSRTIEESAHSDVQLKYDLNKKTSLTAFWENTGQIEQEKDEELLGLDFEFNFDF